MASNNEIRFQKVHILTRIVRIPLILDFPLLLGSSVGWIQTLPWIYLPFIILAAVDLYAIYAITKMSRLGKSLVHGEYIFSFVIFLVPSWVDWTLWMYWLPTILVIIGTAIVDVTLYYLDEKRHLILED